MRLDSTASRRTKGRMRRWGLGSRLPSPASLPIAWSASESVLTSSGVQVSFGGSGLGTKAQYSPRQWTLRPGELRIESLIRRLLIFVFDYNRKIVPDLLSYLSLFR